MHNTFVTQNTEAFQFQNGTIKAIGSNDVIREAIMFQFQNGTIKAILQAYNEVATFEWTVS